MKRNYRVFAEEIQHLSGIEQRIVQTVTLTKWLRTQLRRHFNLIITNRLDHVAADFQASTGQRLYVRQIARGIYRQLSDDNGHSDFEMVEHYAHFVQTDIERDHKSASPVDNWKV